MAFLDETGVVQLTSDIKTLADAAYSQQAAIAPAYSASSAYAVGDYCMHNGLLYKCNTAIGSGGESWNVAHWTATVAVAAGGVPDVTAADNDKFLRVVNGAWAAVTVPEANGVSF